MTSILIIFYLVIEFAIFILIFNLRKKSLWIATNFDEKPKFDKNKVKLFIENTFNKNLGWNRKPRTTGTEKTFKKKTKFSITLDGARKSKYSLKKNKRIAVFGDSFVFSRYVNDHNAWPEHISRLTKSHIMNFGVGNFGFDQALIKYENLKLPKSVKVVIIGVVPETISRIHSHWKHYYEHGNIFGFKPFYKLINKKKFRLIKNPIRGIQSFEKIEQIINSVRQKDIFYKKKFKKFKFTFPYTLSIFKLFPLKFFLLYYLFNSIFEKKKNYSNLRSFKKIYQYNINFANSLYKKIYFTETFDYLIKRFKSVANNKKHTPLIIIFPQKYDLKNSINMKNFYSNYFNQFRKNIKILDLTDHLKKKKISKLYFDDIYGGHLNNFGNKYVSKIILKFIKENVQIKS